MTRERVEVQKVFDVTEPLTCRGCIRVFHQKYLRTLQSNETSKAGKSVLLFIVFV